jgi:predicted acetyltransferase
MGRNTADFHGVTLKFEHANDSSTENCDHHTVTAFDKDSNHVGTLTWFVDDTVDEPGAIEVKVSPKHRRKGIATAMYNFALQKSAEHDIIAPSLTKSSYGNQGYKWARSLGLPKNFLER